VAAETSAGAFVAATAGGSGEGVGAVLGGVAAIFGSAGAEDSGAMDADGFGVMDGDGTDVTAGFTTSVGAGGVGVATGAAVVSEREAVVSDPDTAGATLLSAGKRKGRAAFTIASTSPASAEVTTRRLNHGNLRVFS
jgi:hypothetical protein